MLGRVEWKQLLKSQARMQQVAGLRTNLKELYYQSINIKTTNMKNNKWSKYLINTNVVRYILMKKYTLRRSKYEVIQLSVYPCEMFD